MDSIQLVVHSPLTRARETCRGLFIPHSSSDEKAISIMEHPQLYERSVKEHIRPSVIKTRIERFVEWLLDREEETIAVVGHSSFFRAMSGIEADNCSVWRLTLNEEGKWSNAQLLLPCPEVEI